MAKIDRTAITIINSINEKPNELWFLFVFNDFNLFNNNYLNIKNFFFTKQLKFYKYLKKVLYLGILGALGRFYSFNIRKAYERDNLL